MTIYSERERKRQIELERQRIEGIHRQRMKQLEEQEESWQAADDEVLRRTSRGVVDITYIEFDE